MYRDLAEQFNRLHLLRRLYVHKTMPEHDLHMGQLPVLEYVMEHEGCTQVEIAQALSVSPASIATSTKRLQRSGLLEKRGDDENLRIKRLSATPEGVARSLRCREAFDEMDRRALDGFSDEELQQLQQMLRRISGNIAATINEAWAGEGPSTTALMRAMEEMHHCGHGSHGRPRPHSHSGSRKERDDL